MLFLVAGLTPPELVRYEGSQTVIMTDGPEVEEEKKMVNLIFGLALFFVGLATGILLGKFPSSDMVANVLLAVTSLGSFTMGAAFLIREAS